MSTAQQMMRDYTQIARPSPPPSRLPGAPLQPWVKPEDILDLHRDHRAWLVNALSQSHPATDTVIVTHHGPHPDAAGVIDALTPAFHSDLSDLIHSFAPTAWFFGHSHRRLRARVGQTDIRNVSIGYPDEHHSQSTSYLRKACVWESDHDR